eukprot:UN09654
MVPHHDLWIIWTSIFCGIFCSGRFFRKKKKRCDGKRCLLTIFNCPSQRQKGLEVQFAASAACQLPHGDFFKKRPWHRQVPACSPILHAVIIIQKFILFTTYSPIYHRQLKKLFKK